MMKIKRIAAVVAAICTLLLAAPAAAQPIQSASSPHYYSLTDINGVGPFDEQETVYYELPGGYVYAVDTEAYINVGSTTASLNCMVAADIGGGSGQQHTRYYGENLNYNNTPAYAYGNFDEDLNWIQGNYVTFKQRFGDFSLCSGTPSQYFGGVDGQLTLNQGWSWSGTSGAY